MLQKKKESKEISHKNIYINNSKVIQTIAQYKAQDMKIIKMYHLDHNNKHKAFRIMLLVI